MMLLPKISQCFFVTVVCLSLWQQRRLLSCALEDNETDTSANTCSSTHNDDKQRPILDVPSVPLHKRVSKPVLILGTAQLVTIPNHRADFPPEFTGFLPE